MFEKEAEEWWNNEYSPSLYDNVSEVWQRGAEFGYNFAHEEIDYLNRHWGSEEERKANEWFDAKTSIPVPKKAEIYRYTLEVISDKGDIVCYDYKDKDWKELVIEDEKVTYVPVEIEKWCNKPRKED